MKSLLNICGFVLLVFTAIAGLLLQSTKVTALTTGFPIGLIILIVIGLFFLNRPVRETDNAPVEKLDDMLDQAGKMKDNLRK